MPLVHARPETTAVVLIDHQVGTMSWVRSTDLESLTARAVALAGAAVGLGMPLVLTSSLEDRAQGPMLPDLERIAPDAYRDRIRRTGVVNAMDDPAFAAAVADTGRTVLVIAGVTNDVCTVFPTLTALEQGYQVKVVADAGGSLTVDSDAVALRRMERAGADVVGTSQLLAELAVDWESPAGKTVQPLSASLIPG